MKNYIIAISFAFLAVLFFSGCTQKIAQQSDTISRNNRFDNNWKFSLGDTPEASAVDFDDESWRSLDLPHDWSIEGELDPQNPTGNDGGYFPAGIGWYRKTFEVPAELKDKKVSIYFEGVYMNAEVFVNGTSLGVHPYGYTSFYYDISNLLHYGTTNLIAVKVDNSIQRNSRWYSGSGIYRHVWLQVTAPVHGPNGALPSLHQLFRRRKTPST